MHATCHLLAPQLLPSASEILALLLMALAIGSEVAEVACGGVDRAWLDWSRCRAGVRLERWEVGVSQNR